jgi:hypothetical protein
VPVEGWFSLIERPAIHRATFGSVKNLNAKIRGYIDGRNNCCHQQHAQEIGVYCAEERVDKGHFDQGPHSTKPSTM